MITADLTPRTFNGELTDVKGRTMRTNLLSVTEVAKELRVSRSQADRLVHGKIEGIPIIPTIRVGSRKRFVPRSVLERWIEENAGSMMSPQETTADASKGEKDA